MEYVSPRTCFKLTYVAKLCDSPSLSEIIVIFALDFINNTQCMLFQNNKKNCISSLVDKIRHEIIK